MARRVRILSMGSRTMPPDSFLSSILAASATLPSVGHAQAAVRPDELHGKGAEREFLIQESPVAGFQYHDGETVWPRLSAGDSLQLLREPANPYDRRAVAVYWGESKLGYVPRAANTGRLPDDGPRRKSGRSGQTTPGFAGSVEAGRVLHRRTHRGVKPGGAGCRAILAAVTGIVEPPRTPRAAHLIRASEMHTLDQGVTTTILRSSYLISGGTLQCR